MKFIAVVLLIMDLYGLMASLIRHYYIEQSKTWSDAQKYCKDHYDDLSTISMTELQQLNPDISGWIGLYRDDLLSMWKWSGGAAETRHGGGGPGSGGGGTAGGVAVPSLDPSLPWSSIVQMFNCVYLDTHSRTINTMDCSQASTFFCMKYTYELVFVPQSKSWEQALDYCRTHHHDLASLHSDKENAEAVDISQADKAAYLWTGLRFLAGQWFWVSQNDLEYQAWDTGDQPQCPPRNLHCGALEKKRKIWTPRDCEEKLNFICFKE